MVSILHLYDGSVVTFPTGSTLYPGIRSNQHHGSILGPFLFIIYINDIVNSSNVLSFVLFGDDTTVYAQNDSIDSVIEILNSELAKVALWFASNKLTPNVKKTQMIMLPRKKILTPQNQVILRNEVVQ